jgi:hypothetical protein
MYKVLQDISLLNNKFSDAGMHRAGTILDDSQVPALVQEKIHEGDAHYCSLFEPLDDDETVKDRADETAEASPDATTPRELRWAGAAPGDEEHARELDARLTELESRVDAVEQSRGFVIGSPMSGAIGRGIDADADREDT